MRKGGLEGDLQDRMEFIFDLFPDMRGFLKQRARTLSGGQQQMLAVARALMNDNELLLIDEPTEGLSPLLAKNLISALDRLKEFATILLVEQNFRTVSRLGDSFYIFDNGKIVHQGDNMDELVADKELVAQHLGVRI
jgi:branched-chain amino acid transport system ATP-binding protein